MRKLFLFSALALFIVLPALASRKADVYARSTKLAAILQDAQTSAAITDPAWKSVANEAHHLSNMIMSDLGPGHEHDIASAVRKHVREMRAAAAKGDAAGAKTHAGEALAELTKLIEWSAPK
jgi:hypothetical protein